MAQRSKTRILNTNTMNQNKRLLTYLEQGKAINPLKAIVI